MHINEYNEYMKKHASGVGGQTVKQYTIRGVTPELDRRLNRLAKERGESLNKLVLGLLAQQVDLVPEPPLYRDLDGLAGSWGEDADFDRALDEQRKINLDEWK